MKLLQWINISFFEEEEYGIQRLNFELRKHGRYHFAFDHPERAKAFMGLLEGRYHPQGGLMDKPEEGLFVQSDRQLLGEKVIEKTPERYLMLAIPHFRLDERRTQKLYYLDLLHAKGITEFPIYKLRGEERLKFALLALLFQEKGIALISQLYNQALTPAMQQVLEKIVSQSMTTVILVTASSEDRKKAATLLSSHSFITLPVGKESIIS